MNKIHSGVMNEYQQREYPQDTPEKKAARMEGFEAGRQYEASLRDGVLIPAAEFAALSPITTDADGFNSCFFCKEFLDSKDDKHKPDCLWLRCGGKP